MPGLDLTIDFLDVGQGDGMYIEFPNGKKMIVDLGTTKRWDWWDVAPNNALKFLRSKFPVPGTVLDYLVITHPHEDHSNLIAQFCDELKPNIRYLLFGGQRRDYSKKMQEFFSHAESAGNPVLLKPPPWRPFVLQQDDARELFEQTGDMKGYLPFGLVSVVIMAMNVTTRRKRDAENTASIVMALRYAGKQILLTGDATKETEDHILARADTAAPPMRLRSDVLKVAHHGSLTANQARWIRAIQPSYVFISADRYGETGKSHGGYWLPRTRCIEVICNNTVLTSWHKHSFVHYFRPKDYPVTGKKRKRDGSDDDARPAKRMRIDPGGLTEASVRTIDPMDDKPSPDPPPDPPAQWCETLTEKAIFTTLVQMDRKDPDHSEADQGMQYRVTIGPDGSIEVHDIPELANPPRE